jgi:DNA-binding transcriptional ArsR family regulator
MSTRQSKDALFEAIAVMGKAFASPRRLELIDLLAQGPRSVEELARASGQSTANASQHLQALHGAGVVTRERDGTRMNYSLAGPDVMQLWLELRDASASRIAEVERAARNYLGDEVEAISRDDLLERLRGNEVVLVDVRPAEEFDAGHIAAPSRSHSTSSTIASPNCPPTARSSRTAAAPSAPTRTRRSARFAREGARHGGSKAAGPNGSSRSRR